MLSILLISLSLTIGTVGYMLKASADEMAYLTSSVQYELKRDFEDGINPCLMTQAELDKQSADAGAYEIQLDELCN